MSERPSLSSHCVHDICLGSAVSWLHGGWLKGKGGSALMQIYWWVISLAKYCNSGVWQEMCKLHAWHCGFSTHSHLQWPLEGTARLLFVLLSFGFSCAWWQVATASWTNCIWYPHVPWFYMPVHCQSVKYEIWHWICFFAILISGSRLDCSYKGRLVILRELQVSWFRQPFGMEWLCIFVSIL